MYRDAVARPLEISELMDNLPTELCRVSPGVHHWSAWLLIEEIELAWLLRRIAAVAAGLLYLLFYSSIFEVLFW